MANPDPDKEPAVLDGELRFVDIAPSIEIICWTALAIFPFLRWVNGPAVSTDQFVVQVVMVCTAALGAVGLRIYNWRRRS